MVKITLIKINKKILILNQFIYNKLIEKVNTYTYVYSIEINL